VLVWLSVWSEVQIVCIWSSWCHCHPQTPSSLASFKSRLVLPSWYWLTQAVLEQRPLNGCSSSSPISATYRSFNRTRQVAPICTPYLMHIPSVHISLLLHSASHFCMAHRDDQYTQRCNDCGTCDGHRSRLHLPVYDMAKHTGFNNTQTVKTPAMAQTLHVIKWLNLNNTEKHR